ncbi:MAG: hypothetical protein KY394_03685 [Actinobacteria bacterium]|nr:hypothetical protein [Actinomycetota bacterium]
MIPFELRVHGVSGTPPEAMLYTRPVSYDLEDRSAKVYEPHRDPYQVKAFHWGSLTAGRPHTALWILLAPFAMANVAGWLSDRPNPWTRAFIRVAGLALTGVFFAQIANMTLHIPFETRIRHLERPEVWSVWLLAATASLTLLGLTSISAQSNFRRLPVTTRVRLVFSPLPGHMSPEDGGWGDPAEGARLVSPAMWAPHAVVHRLRRLHIASGALVLSLGVGAGIGDRLVATVSVAGLLLATFLVLATTWVPNSMIFTRLPTAILPLASVAWLGFSGWAIAGSDLGSGLTAVDDVTFGLAMILLVVGLFALFGEWVKAGPAAGWVALGSLSIALLVGASLGLTGGLLVEDLLAPAPGLRTFERAGAWTALVMLGLTALLLAVAAAMALIPLERRPGEPPQDVARESRLRRIVVRSRALLAVAGVYGIAAGIATALAACATGPGCDRSRLPIPAWVAEEPGGAIELAGLGFDLTSLLGWTKLVIVVIPAVLILRSVMGGLIRGQEARRKVSILWDIGSFWPRWYHPLAPPAYGPNAVTRLTEELETRSPDILSAHSQGSLIAAAAVAMAPPLSRPLVFITYGSPLGMLYRRLFPCVGLDEMTLTADEAVGARWLNLWRRSDPIGGQRIDPLGERNWHVDTGSGHSDLS